MLQNSPATPAPIFYEKLEQPEYLKDYCLKNHTTLLDVITSFKEKKIVPIKKIDGKLNPAYDKFKKSLSCVVYPARFHTRRICKYVSYVTKLMFLEIDDLSLDECIRFREILMKTYDWIIFSNISLSGTGLHFVIYVDINYEGSTYWNLTYNNTLKFIAQTYFHPFLEGYSIDFDTLNLNRGSVIGFDLSILVNWNPSKLIINPELVKTTVKLNASGKPKTYKELKDYDPNQKYKILNGENPEKEYSLNDLIDQTPHNYLRLKEYANPNLITDKNIPLDVSPRVKVLYINLFLYEYNKVATGRRNTTLNYFCCLALVIGKNCINKKEIQRELHSFNYKYCSETLDESEVDKIYYYNLNQFQKSPIEFENHVRASFSDDVSKIWALKSTLKLKGKKISVSKRIEHDKNKLPIIEKMKNSVIELSLINSKITKQMISDHSGLSKYMVKRYYPFIKGLIDQKVSSLLIKKRKKVISNDDTFLNENETFSNKLNDTNKNKNMNTKNVETKISECIDSLIIEKKSINQKVITELTGVSKGSVKRHWHTFKIRIKEHKDTLKGISNDTFSNDTSEPTIEELPAVYNTVEDNFHFNTLRYILSEDYAGLKDWELSLKIMGTVYMFKTYPEYKVDKEQVQEFYTLLRSNTRI